MNYTLLNAGRTTHLKIVVVALVAATAVVAVGINARTGGFTTARAPADGTIIKAGQPATYAGQEASTVR